MAEKMSLANSFIKPANFNAAPALGPSIPSVDMGRLSSVETPAIKSVVSEITPQQNLATVIDAAPSAHAGLKLVDAASISAPSAEGIKTGGAGGEVVTPPNNVVDLQTKREIRDAKPNPAAPDKNANLFNEITPAGQAALGRNKNNAAANSSGNSAEGAKTQNGTGNNPSEVNPDNVTNMADYKNRRDGASQNGSSQKVEANDESKVKSGENKNSSQENQPEKNRVDKEQELKAINEKKGADITKEDLDRRDALKKELATPEKKLTPEQQMKKDVDDLFEQLKKDKQFTPETAKTLLELSKKANGGDFMEAINDKANRSIIESIMKPSKDANGKEMQVTKEVLADIQEWVSLMLAEQALPQQLKQTENQIRTKQKGIKELEDRVKTLNDGNPQKPAAIMELGKGYAELNGYFDYLSRLDANNLHNKAKIKTLSAKFRSSLGLANWLTTMKDVASASISSRLAGLRGELMAFNNRSGYVREAATLANAA